MARPEWYRDFFDADWQRYMETVPAAVTRRQADFVVGRLELEPGARVLDLACGTGRIAIALARRGMRVTGLDISERSIRLAERSARRAAVDVRFVRADMRQLEEVAAYDGVVNLYTSFGYFAREEDDELTLAAARRAMVTGGGFLLDTVNPVALAARFSPREWTEFPDGTVVAQERRYDHVSGRIHATWTFIPATGPRDRLEHSVRAYTAAELHAMLARACLPVTGAWGGFDGRALGEGTRTILVARAV